MQRYKMSQVLLDEKRDFETLKNLCKEFCN